MSAPLDIDKILGPLSAADNAFLEAVKVGGPQPCSHGGFAHIKMLAKMLSAATAAANSHFTHNGMFGIFSTAESTKQENLTIRTQYAYGDSKSRFFHDAICALTKAGRPPRTLCEVGFNAGHTALLFHETAPQAMVYSFDLLRSFPWSARNKALMRKAYGARSNAIDGDSTATLPRYHAEHPHVRCDVALIDGAKDARIRLADITNFQRMSSPSALLLLDEICTRDCANGERSCGKGCWGGTSDAYTMASRQGMINVTDCAWPRRMHGKDGVCTANYLESYRAEPLPGAPDHAGRHHVATSRLRQPGGLRLSLAQE